MRQYNPLFEPQKLICIVAWNKSESVKLDENLFNKIRKAGIHVANLPLTTEILARLEKDEGVSICFPKDEHVSLGLVLCEDLLDFLLAQNVSPKKPVSVQTINVWSK